MKCKIWVVAVLLMTLVCSVFWTGCSPKGTVSGSVVFAEEQMVVIKVDSVDGKSTLMQVMEKLKNNGDIIYEESQGMITSINGKAGETISATEGYSWFLYTSDEEFSLTEWGTVEYDGKTYGSAAMGASSLNVKAGEYYIWYLSKWSY